MFSMSMTTGPTGLIESRVSIIVDRHVLARLLRRFLVVGHFRAVFQLTTDRAVTSRNHFVARLDAALDLPVSVVRNSGRYLDQLRLAPFLQKHNLRQLFAVLFPRRFFLTLIR